MLLGLSIPYLPLVHIVTWEVRAALAKERSFAVSR